MGKKDSGELVELAPDQLCSMNMMGFGPQIWGDVEQYFKDFLSEHLQEEKSEFYMPLILARQISENSALVPVLKTNAKWFGVTYQADKASTAAEIDALIAAGVYPKKLW